MPDSENWLEMSAWSNADIERALMKLVPEGCTFGHGFDPMQGWRGQIKTPEGNALWQQERGLDERVILFSAYGWLRFQGHTPRNPAWALRKDSATRQALGRMGLPGVDIPDPLDLNRDEILGCVAACFPEDPTQRK
jgi:hypothetical protein